MAKRSIADVGESLLGGLQSRSRDDEKSAKRKLITAFALQLGIGISNSVLRNKSDDYYKNQQVMDKQIKHRAALAIAAEAKNTQTKILNYTEGTAEDYIFNTKVAPSIRATAREDLAKQGNNIDDLDDIAMEAWVSEKGRPIAKQLVESHNSIIENTSRLGTSDQANAAIINSNKQPKNLGKFLFGMVTGRSKSEYTDAGLRELEATGYFSAAESITNAQALINNNLGFKAAITLAKGMENNGEGSGFEDKGTIISEKRVMPTKEMPVGFTQVVTNRRGVEIHSQRFDSEKDKALYNETLKAPTFEYKEFTTVNSAGERVQRTIQYTLDSNKQRIGAPVYSDIIMPPLPLTPAEKRSREKYINDEAERVNYTNIRAEVANAATKGGTNKVDEMATQLDYQVGRLNQEDREVFDDYFKKMSTYNMNPNGGGKGDRAEMELEALTASSIYLQRKYNVKEAEAKTLSVDLYIKKITDSKLEVDSIIPFFDSSMESDIPDEQVGLLMDLPINGSSLLTRAISIGNIRVAKQITNNQEALTEDILSMKSEDISVVMEQLTGLKNLNFATNTNIFKPLSTVIPKDSYYYEESKPGITWWKYLNDNASSLGAN